jgi:hypothetical protein
MPRTAKRTTSTRSTAISLASIPLALGCVAFNAAAAGDTGKLPSRILIAKWGENLARDGQGGSTKFYVGELTAGQLAKQQELRGWDTVTGDYEHQSVQGHPNFKEDPREYWAHGRVEVVAGQGLYFVPEKYTPSGLQNAANYPDVSGQFFLDKNTRQVVAVKSVALCQNGMVAEARNLQAIAASIAESYMGDPDAIEEALSFARDLLGLDDTASANDVRDGLKDLVAQKAAEDQDPENPNPNSNPDTDMDEAKVKELLAAQNAATNEKIDKLTAAIETTNKNITTLTASQATAEHNRAVEIELNAAVTQGKKVPDSLKKKDDAGRYTATPDLVKEVVAAIPATESVEFQTPERLAAAQRPTTGAEEQICATLAVKKDEFAKHAKGEGGIVLGNQDFKEAKKGIAAAA